MAANELERHFARAAGAIVFGAAIAALGGRLLGAQLLSGNDLVLFCLAAAALLLNLRSWRRFVDFFTGDKSGWRAFVLFKSAALALLIALLTLGKMRGLVIFLLSLVLFLFGGAAFYFTRAAR